MRYGSLFSGYGGLDRAIEAVFGAKAAWNAEIEPAPCKVLEARWPGVPNLGDVSGIDWSTVERPEILCGGFPCTDLSAAGKRAGLNPLTRSGLWLHFARAIKELRPELVVIENVRGLLSTVATHPAHQLGFCPGCLGDEPERVVLRALGAVLGDLADLGFDAEWVGLPASGVGAAHGRFRVFVLAWPAANTSSHASGVERRGLRAVAGSSTGTTAVATDFGHEGSGETRDGRSGPTDSPDLAGWGIYGPAIRRWESAVGRPAPFRTVAGQNGQPKPAPRFVEWMNGLPHGWVTDVPGITVNEQLKMLGNGVVPQQAEVGIRYLYERVKGKIHG